MGRAYALLSTSNPKSKLGTTILRADLRRLSVVMAVAALDTYMHRLVVERAFWHEDLPPALAKLDIRFDQLLAQVDATTAAARSDPHNSRPRVGAKRQLRDRLLRETFQGFGDVSRALSMAGQRKNWDAIGKELNPPLTPSQIEARLNDIVVRRNKVVHEGDYERMERPRGPRRNPMSHTYARGSVAFVGALIDAIHAVVSG
jgi:hypothetical protein